MSHLREEHARRQAQSVLVQSIKEDIIDAVNDLKAKDNIWALNKRQKEQCDVIIKKMVFNARESDHVAHAYDLVRGLFDIVRDVIKAKTL